MKTSTEYKVDTKVGLLLVGAPLSGKTNVAMCFPDPWFLDADDKLSNAVRRFPKDKVFYYDNPNLGDDGKELKAEDKWDRTVALTKAALVDPRPKTIVIDSTSAIARFLQEHLVARGQATKDLMVGGYKVMTQMHWYPFAIVMEKFIMMCRSVNKFVIFTAHIDVDKDEISGTLMERPLIGGQLKNSMGKLFTDVWACHAVPTAIGTEYRVRTAPTPRMMLGTSLGLPSEFVFTWSEIQKRLEGK